MALFSKPPAKKPQIEKPIGKLPEGVPRTPVSARDIAAQAQGRRGNADRPRAEPAADISMAGASLMDMSPARTSIEVGQTNPGMCAVLENAALLFASGQTLPARAMLEDGIVSDPDARNSALAWLALFDLLQRTRDRAAFDQLALQYVVQFERSAPGWDEQGGPSPALDKPKAAAASGVVVITGKLTEATAAQIEGFRRTLDKGGPARLDLAQVAGFDDAGARLLADALAYARKRRVQVAVQRSEKIRAALDILVKRGRDAGEGAWLLGLEFLQFDHKQEAFDDRAIEYAIAFEQSPPSWEPPPEPPRTPVPVVEGAHADEVLEAAPGGAIVWTGIMAGPSAPAMGKIAEHAASHPVVVIDLSHALRVDFVCAGALVNTITRVEGQRKSVQIVGATPIIRALLLLIGISPRHFLKKLQ